LETKFEKVNWEKETIKRELARLRRRFPDLFSFTFLNGNGELIDDLTDIHAPRAVLKRFFIAYSGFLDGKPEKFRKEQSIIQGFLGQFVPVGEKIHWKVIPASPDESKHSVYISYPGSKGMFIVHLRGKDDYAIQGFKDRIALFNSAQQFARINLIETGVPPLGSFREWRIPVGTGIKLFK